MYWVIEAIVQLLTAATQLKNSPLSFVKNVFWGDPIKIPRDSMPAIVVQGVGTAFKGAGSRFDRKVSTVDVRLVDNYENYTVLDSTGKAVPLLQEFIRRMELSDVDQSTLRTSVAGLLQSSQSLPYLDADNVQRYASILVNVRTINYVFNNSRPFPSFEAILTVDVTTQGDR